MAAFFTISTSFLSPSVTKPNYASIRATAALQSPTTAKAPPPSVATFWEWLTEKGVVSGKTPVRPGVVTEGLGLVAKRDIGRNEVVLEVPKKFWINPKSVEGSEIGRICGGLKPWISVALFLIREKLKGDGSDWKAYLDVLPESTDSTLFWSEEELAELQGTQLLNTTQGVKQYLQKEFQRVEQDILKPHKQMFPSNVTLEDFTWAFGILRSRAFSRLRGEDLVLIPLADLINHSQDITTEDYAYEIKGAGLFSRDLLFSLRSPVSVKAGEQVLIQYDLNKSNAELALDYGFVESKPDRNVYTLTLQISEEDQFVGDKLDVAETNGMGETADFDIILGYPLPTKLLPYLRLVALGGTDAFLLESIFRNTIWDHLQLPISRANEELICRVVRDACKSALSGFHTTIEEDEKLMQGEDSSPRLRIAAGIRSGEKKVLQQIDEIFKQREEELDEIEYYQERRLKDLGLVGEQGDIIFWE
ncbi:[Fructose-bisphosphate aldolase]-lysine N-methyltransferase, chloroplastic [Linum perenne]